MHQVLFFIPFTSRWLPPDGVPLYGFGAMLFLTFVLTAMVWGPRRVVQVGLPKDKLQDMAILLFLTGIAGARIVYMIQYSDQFPDKSFRGLATAFIQIWNGGIVFYGSIFGGLIGYAVFYFLVMRRFQVSGWKLADAVAPLIAFGLAIGRIGCYLNGCCWGQPVCEECQPVPLAPELGKFPLLPAHAREQVVRPATESDRMPQIRGLQTVTGFSIAPRADERIAGSDPRSWVFSVEPGSAAEKAGLKAGDRVVEVNGQANEIILEFTGAQDTVNDALKAATHGRVLIHKALGEESEGRIWIARLAYSEPQAAFADKKAVAADPEVSTYMTDTLSLMVKDWPRGRAGLDLVVDRAGQKVPLSFTPRTVAFFPTQLYETVSMLLITFLLISFQPFRRHDGQVMVLLMLGYAVHRFLNEAIRIEPTYAMNLTLSQWISIAIFGAGLCVELYLRASRVKLPSGELPISYGVTPPATPVTPVAV